MYPYLYKQLNVRILIFFIWRDQIGHFDSGFIKRSLTPLCQWDQGEMARIQEESLLGKKNLLTVLTVLPADCSDGLGHATSAWRAALFWFGPWAQLSGVQHALTVTLRPKIASKRRGRSSECLLLYHLHSLHTHSRSLAFMSCQRSITFSASPVKKIRL